MSEYTVHVDHIHFARDDQRGEDGAIYYLILNPCEDCKTHPGHHACKAHPGMTHHYERQGFRLGSFGHRLNATAEEIADDAGNVWGWDGSREAPSLTPSYLAMEHNKKGEIIRPYRMHSFLRAGRLELCGDSTVVLASNPVSCWYDE